VLHYTKYYLDDQINKQVVMDTQHARERVEAHVRFGWGNAEGKRPLGRTRPRQYDIIKNGASMLKKCLITVSTTLLKLCVNSSD